MQIRNFQELLKQWYNTNKRELPWRHTRDPYQIWLSEVILQQTRVNQGLPYYSNFVQSFPNVEALADASTDEVLKLWEGLGYYSRARNMHQASIQVMEERNGDFPSTYDELIRLKGVGEYTAAAVSSFASGEARAVLDGNVFRVLSRYLGIDHPINVGRGKKVFQQAADRMLDHIDPATYNQAIMEFGALQCVPRNPDCGNCILKSHCHAYTSGRQHELPVKQKKKYSRQRHFNFLLFETRHGIPVQRRMEKDIWKGLFQFPLVESSDGNISFEGLLNEIKFLNDRTSAIELPDRCELPPHRLSHQLLYCTVWKIRLEGEADFKEDDYTFVAPEQLRDLAFPRPLRQYIDTKYLKFVAP